MKKPASIVFIFTFVTLFSACGPEPAITVSGARWQQKIANSAMMGAAYSPEPGYTFLVVGASFDFGTKAKFSTGDLSIISTSGKSYEASGGCAPFLPSGGIRMGTQKWTLEDGKLKCPLVFSIPNDEKATDYMLRYGWGATVPFSVN